MKAWDRREQEPDHRGQVKRGREAGWGKLKWGLGPVQRVWEAVQRVLVQLWVDSASDWVLGPVRSRGQKVQPVQGAMEVRVWVVAVQRLQAKRHQVRA